MKDRLTISSEMMVRIPQFPMTAKLQEEWESLKESIRISSGEFYEMIKDVSADDIDKLPPQVYHTVWKYFNRSKFRPIPYGSFAGFGIARYDKASAGNSVTIEPRQILHRLIGWEALNEATGQQVKLTDATLLFTNSSWYKTDGSVRYLAIREGVFSLAEVGIAPMLLEILVHCRHPVTFKRLVMELDLKPGDFKLVRQMQQLQLLFTDKAPNIIGDDFFERVGIANHPDFPQYIIAERKPVRGFPNTTALKSLLSLIPIMEKIMRPANRSAMDAFKEGFIKKFEERSIPLMRALDPELGLSYSNTVEQDTEDGFVKRYTEKANTDGGTRSRELEKILLSALSKGSREPVRLDYIEKDKTGEFQNLPNSISVVCSVVDGLVILDHLGGANASSLAGRFSMVSADAEKLCRDWALQEQHANAGVLFFDIAYAAEKATDNINRRKHIYPLQLSLLNFDTSSAPLTLDDIYLTSRKGEMILFSARHGKRLIPRLTSAYNYTRSDLSVFRFLCDLQFEGISSILLFNISSAVPDLDFYPRLQFKNIIISPAKWRVDVKELAASVEDPLVSLKLYLRKMGMPRYLVTRTHDRTMCFDCNSETDLDALHFVLKKFKRFYLEEGFISGEAIVKDTDGNGYASQLLFSVNHSRQVYKPFNVPAQSKPLKATRQNFAAGSAWLYYEIFSHPRLSDPVIRQIDTAMVQRNYLQIKQEVRDIVDSEIERMNNDPGLRHLIIQKLKG